MPVRASRDPGAPAGLYLSERLASDSGPPLVLDGAIGTELERRGVETGLPLWSSHALQSAPQHVAEIHRDYAAAGAQILTANTFRTQRRVIERADPARPDPGGRAADLTQLAVGLARSATLGIARRVLVAGSAPTLEDCYQPERCPDRASLESEHREHAGNLARAGVDLILVETMNSIKEARAAAEAASATGLPFLVSFVSWSDGLLLSGEPLADAIRSVEELGPHAVLANCLPPSAVASCLQILRESGVPFGIYANLGAPNERGGSARREDCSPDEFARHAAGWVAAGARIVGGCCGTTPDHIRAVTKRLHELTR